MLGSINALEFELTADKYMSVIVWPDNPPTTIRLISSRKTWMTAKAGDAVLVNGVRHFIKEVRLYRVDLVEENGSAVESGQTWLNNRMIGATIET